MLSCLHSSAHCRRLARHLRARTRPLVQDEDPRAGSAWAPLVNSWHRRPPGDRLSETRPCRSRTSHPDAWFGHPGGTSHFSWPLGRSPIARREAADACPPPPSRNLPQNGQSARRMSRLSEGAGEGSRMQPSVPIGSHELPSPVSRPPPLNPANAPVPPMTRQEPWVPFRILSGVAV